MFSGLWIDSAACMPNSLAESNWTHARSIWEALLKLELLDFEKISINCNMISTVGLNNLTACDLLKWMEDRYIDRCPPKIIVHEKHNQSGCSYCIKNCGGCLAKIKK